MKKLNLASDSEMKQARKKEKEDKMELDTIKGNQNTTKLIQYLKSQEKQYPPLDYESERAMIEKNKKNRDKLERLLYLHNIRLVFMQAKNWKRKVNEFDEMVQDALNGLGEACRRFDPWKQAHDKDTGEPKFMPDGSPAYVKFSTFAMPWINKMILERFYKKNVEVERNSISMSTPAAITSSKSDGRETATLEDYIQEYIEPSCFNQKTLTNQLSAQEQSSVCKGLYRILEEDSSLSATDRAIFTDMFTTNSTREILSRKYRVPKKYVDELRFKTLKKLKKVLENEYHIHSFGDLYSA